MSTYEKELMAIVQVVHRWRAYLEDQKFIIKIDHQGLKYLFEQRISSVLQQKWVTKLLGLDYEIQYKKGVENFVADALSWVNNNEESTEEEAQLQAISIVQPTWHKELINSYQSDPELQHIISQLLIDPQSLPEFSFVNELLRYQGKLYVGDQKELKQQILQEVHNSGIGGHSGQLGKYKKASSYFY